MVNQMENNETVENELLQVISEDIKLQESNNEEEIATRPSQTDPEYSDYILSQFSDNEVVIKYNKNKIETARYPKVNGLRRIARLYVGEILESFPTPVQVIYNPLDGFECACFLYTVIFSLRNDKTLKYSDVGEIVNVPGDNKFSNIDVKFGRFPSSIAVTRAEARTLRKAIGLNTIAFEELDTEKGVDNSNDEQPFLIKDVQKNMIKVFCKRLDIDISKYINTGPYAYDSLDKVSFSHAAAMTKQLESFQRPEGKMADYKAKYNISL